MSQKVTSIVLAELRVQVEQVLPMPSVMIPNRAT